MVKNLIKNTSYLLISQISIIFIGLLSQIIMARLLLPEGRGIYALCIVYSSSLILITNFGNEFGIRFLFLKNKINISDSFIYLIITTATSFCISFIYFFILLKSISILKFLIKLQLISFYWP